MMIRHSLVLLQVFLHRLDSPGIRPRDKSIAVFRQKPPNEDLIGNRTAAILIAHSSEPTRCVHARCLHILSLAADPEAFVEIPHHLQGGLAVSKETRRTQGRSDLPRACSPRAGFMDLRRTRWRPRLEPIRGAASAFRVFERDQLVT